jgi:succinate dehydrogenase / fumarate reductase, membrane anchor subunit
MRWIITDYVRHPQRRFWAKTVLYLVAGFMIVLGTITIVTFSPIDCAPAS